MNGSTWWPHAYDPDIPKMSVWRCDGAPHRSAPPGGQIPGADRGTLPNSQSSDSTPSPSVSTGMPPLYPRTMEDVDDAEAAAMEGLIRGEGGTPSPPSSPTMAASAPRLDAPSRLAVATIDLTSDVSP